MTSSRDRGAQRTDEMHDTPQELEALDSAPDLKYALETLGNEVTGAFDDADRKALQHQRSYRRITWWATTFGTLSILLSIASLTFEALDVTGFERRFLIAQVFTLSVTAAAVFRGLFAYRHENWLLERCRAEQLRALKFVLLLDPLVWRGNEDDRRLWANRVRTAVERVRALRYHDIASIAGKEEIPDLRPAHVPESRSLSALVSYYNRKRLEPQRSYFLDAATDPHHFGTRALPLFFFAAVLLEVVQVVLMVIVPGEVPTTTRIVATSFAAVAIALPAVWAGIRTQQGAREGSRNALRSKARHYSLTQLSDRMQAARGNPIEILWTMRLTEFVLEVDQREWLRLLREAEWYG